MESIFFTWVKPWLVDKKKAYSNHAFVVQKLREKKMQMYFEKRETEKYPVLLKR